MNRRGGFTIVALILLPALLPSLSCGGSGGESAATATDLCISNLFATCDKAYQCVPAASRDSTFETKFGTSLSDCKRAPDQLCETAGLDCPNYNAAQGTACVRKLSALTCGQFLANEFPAECAAACPP